jgi:hypothetical protein
LLLTAPAGFASYVWSNGATTQTTYVRGAGAHNVQVVTSGGCISLVSANTTTTVGNVPNGPTITATGSTTRCDGDSVTLSAPNSNSYLWSTGATTRTIVVKVSGSYTVQTKATATGCLSAVSNPTVVTINPLPATPTVTQRGSDGDSVQASVSGGTRYLWYLNGTLVPALTTEKVKITTSGNYTVRVIAGGCTSAVSAATVVTGLANSTKLTSNIKLFPNPNNGQFQINVQGLEDQTLTMVITDLAGKVLTSQEILINQSDFNAGIDLTRFAKGSYLVRISNKAGASATLKTTVQ